MTQKTNMTAVEWLVNEIFAGKTEEFQKQIDRALQMEKDQDLETWRSAIDDTSKRILVRTRRFNKLMERILTTYGY